MSLWKITQNQKITKQAKFGVSNSINVDLTLQCKYRTRAIITRGLYTFYPLFEVQKRFFKGLFS